MTAYSLTTEPDTSDFKRVVQGRTPLCVHLAGVSKAAVTALIKHEERDDELEIPDVIQSSGLSGLPWVTPVLGSGCLGAAEQHAIPVQPLLAAVSARIEALVNMKGLARNSAWAHPQFGETWAGLGRKFTSSLASRRARGRGADDDGGTLPPVSDAAAQLVVVAALMTRFVHASRAIGPLAMERLVDEMVEYPIGPHRADLSSSDDPFELLQSVIEPLKLHVAELRTALDEDPKGDLESVNKTVRDAVGVLLGSVETQIIRSPPSISLNAVRLMTEAAWCFLVHAPGRYYGWTELLLGLILNENEIDPTALRRRPQHGNAQQMASRIREYFLSPSTHSWAERAEAISSPTSRIHDAVALTLSAQSSRYADTQSNDQQRAPRPVAFSTSFDLEVEMSLWSLRIPYSVAVPVHAMTNRYGRAELAWLAADFDPQQGETAFEDFVHPTRWRLLSAIGDTSADDRVRPVVVHLAGCPLIPLPSKDDVRSLFGPSDLAKNQVEELVHAVCLDEYVAHRLADIELYLGSQRSSRGLDRDLVVDGHSGLLGNPRYWMLLGVPIADPAIRQRLLSIFAIRWLIETSVHSDSASRGAKELDRMERLGLMDKVSLGAPLSSAKKEYSGTLAWDNRVVRGVAVNWSIDEDEVYVLRSLGLSIARADAAVLVDGLVDYAAHLADPDPRTRQLSWEACRLSKGRTS